MSAVISWPLRSSNNADFMPTVRKLIKQKYTDPIDCQRALKHLEVLESGQGDIEHSFYILRLACQSRSTRIITIALDCIQKLVAYGYLKGTCLDPYEQTKGLLIDTIVESVCNCYHGPGTTDGVQLQIIKALLTLVTSPYCQVHESSLLLAIQTCVEIYLNSKNCTNQNTAKATLTQMFNNSFQKMESYTGPELDDYVIAQCLSQIVSQVDQNLPHYSNVQEFAPIPNILHYDAYIIFHLLCKLSMRQVSEEHPLKLKLLSLQLILTIMQNAGPILKSSEMFLTAIKQCLCVTLSKNALSNNNEILSLSISIFVCLLKDFKMHLKLQIEVFFKEIIIHIIESPSTTFEQKWIVLDALISMCSDAQCIVDLFVNYDCGLQSTNIFERLVTILSRIAQAKGQSSSKDLAAKIRESNLRVRGFECLVSILKCMVDWSKDLYLNSFLTTSKKLTNGSIHRRSISGTSNGGDSNKLRDTLEKSNNSEDNNLNDTSTISNNSIQIGSLNNNNNIENISKIPNGNQQQTNNNLCNGLCAENDNNQSFIISRDNPEQIEETKMHKGIIEQGFDLFNRKPKKGIQFLQKHGYLGTADEDIARFLYLNSDKLDKATLGEFVGDIDNKEIMYLFVNQMNFAGKDIVAALRHFLDHFRLPGEAQKIDRLMEKFASQYCETNPNNKLFTSADVAYVLSYSIIILTTDLHSPQVKHKMTKEQYIRMNQPTDNKEKGLPEEFLSKIYDEIASCEIKVKGSNKSSQPYSSAGQASLKWTDKLAPSKQRKSLYNSELESMSETARVLMESVSHVEAHFTQASHLEYVKPMFKIAWTPFLVAFSVGLQNINDDQITCLCLLGFRYAIRIAGTFRMHNERDAFVQALSRFTLLTTGQTKSTDIRIKNINTIKTLIMVAHSEGNYLGESWLEILRCISQLDYAQMLGANNQQFPEAGQERSSINDLFALQEKFDGLSITALDGGTRKNIKLLSDSLNDIASQSIFLAVDRIFTGSVLLDGDAIVDFVQALCQVSNEELSNTSQARLFSLQKLVEISYYNMDRIRLQWSKIWSILGNHFNQVGCSTNDEVCIFAIDSLRQLSMKFIEKGEFSNFRFQKDFLRPFECIMRNNNSVSIRDMVVRCICQMVSSQATNIRSGWKNIFNIILMAVWDDEQSIVTLAYETASDIIYQYPKLDSMNEVINESEYRRFVGSIYHSLANLVQSDIRPEYRSVIKDVLLCIGDMYGITDKYIQDE